MTRPRGVVERGLDDLDVDDLAAGRDVLLDGLEGLAGLDHPGVVVAVLLGQLAGEEVEVVLAQDLRRASGPARRQKFRLQKVNRPSRSFRRMLCGRLSTSEW